MPFPTPQKVADLARDARLFHYVGFHYVGRCATPPTSHAMIVAMRPGSHWAPGVRARL
jgi:hypothetical protein